MPSVVTGPAARFYSPWGLASDGAGNLYAADSKNGAIRKIEIATGVVTTLPGSRGMAGGPSGQSFPSPAGMALDGAGDLYVSDLDLNAILKVVLATGEITTLATGFSSPEGVTVDGDGNLYVADSFTHTIRQIAAATGAVTTLAGSPGASGSDDGQGPAARFTNPYNLVVDAAGNVLVADTNSAKVRKIVVATGAVTTVVSSPPGIGGASGIAVEPDGSLSVTLQNAIYGMRP